MRRSSKIKAKRLREFENEFHPLLRQCLRQCAEGRWGLFHQTDQSLESRWLAWPEACRLKELAEWIKAAHDEAGNRNAEVARFLALGAMTGPNVPGEPALAATLLAEIE